MYLIYILCIITLAVNIISIVSACKGCVNLDEYNFDKFIPKYEAVLVKFDVNYPHGEKQDAFTKIASETIDNEHILLAQVPIKKHGEDKNQEFGKRHGILSEDDLPTLKLYVKDNKEPFVFQKNLIWNNENLKMFVLNNTNIYWGLPGRLEVFDKIAIKFHSTKIQKPLVVEAENEANKLTNERQKNIAKTYIDLMSTIQRDGIFSAYKKQKIIEKELKELSHQLNIIKLFTEKQNELPF